MKLKELLEEVRIGERTVLDLSETSEGARTLIVEQRQLLPEEPRPPQRAESKARGHVFHDASSLAAYLARYGGAQTVVFADLPTRTIHAVLDETSKDGLERLSMAPQIHPLWMPWKDILRRKRDIREFAEFVNHQRRSIVAPKGRELALILSQVRAKVEVEAQHGQGRVALNGIMIRTKVEGASRSEVIELPEEIVLRMPIFVQGEPQEITLDLCIEATPDGGVTAMLTEGTVAEAELRAFAEAAKIIEAGIASLTGATMTFGAPRRVGWDYLPGTSVGAAPARGA